MVFIQLRELLKSQPWASKAWVVAFSLMTLTACENPLGGNSTAELSFMPGLDATPTATPSPGTASQLVLSAIPASTTAGSSFNITVTAEDSSNSVMTGYTGTVSITSSDGSATLPASATLTNGVGTFTVTLKTAGTKTVTASDGSLSGTSSNITVNPAAYDVAHSVVTASAATVSSGSSITATLTAKDAYGNSNPSGLPAVGSIAFTSTNVGGTGTFGAITNAGSGVYTSSFTGVIAGAVTLSSTISTVATTGGSASVTVNPGAASQLVETRTPVAPATVDVALTTKPKYEVRDANGNVVTSSTATIAVKAYTASDCLSGGLTSATWLSGDSMSAVAGIADFTATQVKKAGTVYVRAESGALTASACTPLTMVPGAASSIAWTTQPSSTNTAGTNFGTQPAFTIYDQYTNIKTNAAIGAPTVATTTGTGSVVAGYTSSISNGVITFAGVKTNTSGTGKKITASYAGLTSSESSAFDVNPGAYDVSQSIVTASAAAVNSGSSITATLTAKDAYGNSNPSGLPAVGSIAFTSTNVGGTGTFGAITNVGSGVYTSSFTGDVAGAVTLGATISTVAVTGGSASVTVVVGGATQLVFSTQPSASTVSGVAFSQQPIVSIKDSNGNVVTTGADATRVVTISLTTGTGTLAGTLTKTAVAGVADFSGQGLAIDLVGTNKVLTASAPLTVGTTTVTSNAFTITHAAGSELVFSTQPSASTVSAVAFAQQPVVTIKDAQGNVVTTGADATRVVTLSLTTGTGTLAGTLTKTAVAGVADFSGQSLAIDLVGTDKVLTASAPLAVGTTTVTSNAFTITHAAASQIAFTTQPSASTVALVAFAQQPIITIKDAQGNVVTSGADATATISLTLQTGTGSLAGTMSMTAVAGVADFSGQGLNIDLVGTNKVIRATKADLSGSGGTVARTADTNAFTITHGMASVLTYTTQPGTWTSGSSAGTQPVVEVRDAFGNLVTTGVDATATISIALTTGTGTLSGTASVAAVGGVATFAGLSLDLVGTNKVLTVSKPNTTGSGGTVAVTQASNAFTVSHAAASQLVFTTQPSASTVSAVAFATQPIVTIEDAQGNVVTTGADATRVVTISLTTGTGALAGTLTKTAVAGVADFSGQSLAINLVGTDKVLTASAPLTVGTTTVTSNAFTITHAAASQLVFTTQPSASTVSAVAFATQPIVTIEDAQGNAVTTGADATRVVTLSLTTGTGTLAGTLTKTAVAGVADFSGQNLAIDLTGTNKVLTASAPLTVGTTTVTSNAFTITYAAASQLVFSTQPSASTLAGVAFATQPIVTIKDAQGNVVTGGADATRVVTMSLTTGTGVLAGTLTKTAVAGVADFAGQGLAINLIGADKVLTASAPLAVGTTTVDSNAFTVTQSTPTLASAAISNSAPTNTRTYSLTYGAVTGTYSHYCILENDTTVGNCSWTAGTLPASFTVSATENAKVLSVWIKDALAQVSTRVDTGSVTLDTTAPADPSGLSMVTTSPGSSTTPVVQVSGVSNGLSVSIYTGNTCALPTLKGTASATGATVDITSSALSPDGTFTFYALAADSAGNTSACVASVSYVLDTTAPVLASATISNSTPTNTRTYSLTFGAITGTYSHYCILENDTTVGNCSWTAGAVPASFTVSATENAKVLSVWLKDSVGNVSTRVDTGSVTLDTTAPVLASAAISNSSPTASTTYNLTFGAITGTYSHYCILENDTTVGNCSWTAGAVPASFTVSSTQNAKVLSVWLKDSATNVSTRVDTGSVTLDNTAPVAPTAWGQSSPSSGTTSADATPAITGSAAEDTAVVKIWVNDSSCTSGASVGSGTVASGAFSISAFTVSTDGLKTFYYTIEDTVGNATACATTGLSYTYQTNPIYNLSSAGVVIKEDGTQLSTALTITRDVTGIAGVVTITTSDGTALTGSDYTASTITVNFSASDTSQTVAASNFTIVDDTTAEGDEYFKAKLAVSSGGTLGSTITQAMITIVDNEATSDSGDFMFTQPLYTVNDTSSNATLTVIRTGSTAAQATVDVSFVNGTATGGSDYTSTTQTLTFTAGGAIEQTVSVPIAAVSSNKSFYAKLTNPLFTVAGTKDSVRAMSITKVRILDVGNSDSCDAANNDTSVNLGFGGLSGGVYYICSLPQLYKVRNNPTLSFKMISDVDADPSIDADSASGGTQAFTPLSSTNFTGNFDGNERIISNFTYAGSGAADNNRAIFSHAYSATDAGTYIKNVNVLYASVTNVGVNSGILIANYGLTSASADQYSPQLTNDFVSGYLTDAGGTSAMVASNVNIKKAASQTTTIKNILTHGTVVATTNATTNFGGILGNINSTIATPVYDLQKLYNTANIYSTATASQYGGVIARFSVTTATSAFVIDACENRGFLNVSAVSAAGNSYTGGIAGIIGTTAGLRITNSINYGRIQTAQGYYYGGIVASFTNSSSTAGVVAGIDTCINYGNMNHASTSYYSGGMVGYYAHSGANSTSTITNNINYGSITVANGGAAGIAGRIDLSGSSSTLNVTTNSNYGAIAGIGYTSGIVGYSSYGTANSNITADFYNNTSAGTMTCGVSTGANCGGIVGGLLNTLTGTNNLIKVRSNTTTSAVTMWGYSDIGGVVGKVTAAAVTTAGDSIIQITNNTSSASSLYSTLATPYIGQILGSATVAAKAIVKVDSNTAAGALIHPTNSATGASHAQGGVVGAFTLSAGASTAVNTVSNNTVTTNIRPNSGGNPQYIGGVIGIIRANDGVLNVLNNTFAGTFTTNNNPIYLGGLAGYVTALNAATVTIGGTAGTFGGSAASWSYNSANISGNSYVGGLIGNMSTQGTSQVYLKYAYNTGNISASATMVGGVVGVADPSSSGSTLTISNVYNTGTVAASTAGTGKYAGGLVGYIAPINVAAATGTVTIQDSFTQGSTVSGAIGWVGGLVGGVKNNATYTLTLNLTRNYTVSSNTSTSGNKGGLIGDVSLAAGTFTLNNQTTNYFRSDAGSFNSGMADIGGVVGSGQATTNANMQAAGTYSGWSIGASNANVTWFNPGVNGSYPSLSGY